MARTVELSRVLTIRGEEVDCVVSVEVAYGGEEIDITKVAIDAKDGAEIPEAEWPEGLLEQVAEKAIEAAGDQEAAAAEDAAEFNAEDRR